MKETGWRRPGREKDQPLLLTAPEVWSTVTGSGWDQYQSFVLHSHLRIFTSKLYATMLENRCIFYSDSQETGGMCVCRRELQEEQGLPGAVCPHLERVWSSLLGMQWGIKRAGTPLAFLGINRSSGHMTLLNLEPRTSARNGLIASCIMKSPNLGSERSTESTRIPSACPSACWKLYCY